MDWLDLENFPKKSFSPQLVNEFYSGIMLKQSESDNTVPFNDEVTYMFFDGEEHILAETDLGKLLKCENYNCPYKVPIHYPSDNV